MYFGYFDMFISLFVASLSIGLLSLLKITKLNLEKDKKLIFEKDRNFVLKSYNLLDKKLSKYLHFLENFHNEVDNNEIVQITKKELISLRNKLKLMLEEDMKLIDKNENALRISKMHIEDLKYSIKKYKKIIKEIKIDYQNYVFKRDESTDYSNDNYSYVKTGSPLDSLNYLAKEYNSIRETQKPGDERTISMTKVVNQMIELIPYVNIINIEEKLKSNNKGNRLIGYIYLYVKLDKFQIFTLIDTIIDKEDTPFGQYWGLKAVSNIFSNKDIPKAVRNYCYKKLFNFRQRLELNSDRYQEVTKILGYLDY
ncbi:hypothetical protein ACS5NO_24540 [Larkinella sp. GY13]|uniref:hypothetical protein n=1 Tax=Larkinella sp. GY13 TaxID=3453720 RepID=UPI003EF00F1B